MNAREQAEELRQQAIRVLLSERDAIDEQLKILGYEQTTISTKRRGRPPKSPLQPVFDTEVSGNPFEAAGGADLSG